jgi:tetratricopeptide (TPR) repeat protein/DNA-binding CsgD family transcriptional regulator
MSLSDEQLARKIARLGPTREKADLLIELGRRIYYSEIDRARALFEQALELATQLKYPRAIALAHQQLAAYYSRSDRWQQALPHAEMALGLYRELRDRKGEGIALRQIGEAMVTAGEYPKAEEILGQSLAIHEQEHDAESAALTLNAFGFLYWKNARAEEARRAFERAREIFTSTGNRLQQIYTTNNLAVIESDAGNYAGALAMFESLIPLREELGDRSGLVETYSNIGNQYAMFADYATALEYMLKGLRLREELGVGRSDYALSNIALVYSKLGRLDQAEQYYRQALEIAEARDDRAEICDYHSNLAALYLKLEQSERAIEHATRSIALAAEIGSATHAAGGHASLASAYLQSKEYDRALESIEQAIRLARQSGNDHHLEEHLRKLSSIHIAMGDTDRALDAATESVTRARQSGRMMGLAATYELLMEIHERRGELAEALRMSRLRYDAYSSTIDQSAAHKLETLTLQFDVERIRKDAEIARLKAREIQTELEMKKKELSIMALHLVNKNEFLIDLREKITADVRSTDSFIKELARRIEEGITSDSDWGDFENRFTQTNPEFAARLMEKSSHTLTPTELKICTLLRTGLSTKEIANVLLVSTRTVDSHRYNIHRKLGLGEQKLVAYLVGMG